VRFRILILFNTIDFPAGSNKIMMTKTEIKGKVLKRVSTIADNTRPAMRKGIAVELFRPLIINHIETTKKKRVIVSERSI
ncbi:MAG: hypothetical protein WCE64_12965, partial [Bacteroidales bacterium]